MALMNQEELWRPTVRPIQWLLLQHCQVATVEGLAPIWGRLMQAAQGKQQSMIQQEQMTNVCIKGGLMPNVYCPGVTMTGLKQMVMSLNFTGNGPDNLTGGANLSWFHTPASMTTIGHSIM